MINRRTILLSLFTLHFSLFILSPLFASAKKDTTEPVTLNNEWVLCITAFDYSLLPPAHRIAGDVLTRDLVTQLSSVNYRFRISPEYAYYENYAWQQALSAAAKTISNKQTERSQLLFRGEPNWKYRKNLKKIDEEIVKLQESYAQKEAEKPLIHKEPSFDLNQANKNGTYPAPPKPGEERRFCQNQKVDAFLTGEVREFHGRYYINLRLFTLYTNSWVYDDDIIFSLDDSGGAVDEIAARLSTVLSGTRPATIAITADPPESQILINHNYAGRGTVETQERPPGEVTIAIAADDYRPETVVLNLEPGEQVDVAVTLGPLYYSNVHINAPGFAGASVYHGALYVGEAPLTLRLPVGQLNYVTVEEPSGERAKAVFTAPDMPEISHDINLKLKMPPLGERRVNKARNWYYWAWAGTWITGLTAWVTYGWYTIYNDALPKDVNGNPYAGTDPDFIATTNMLRMISTGAIIAVGVAVVHEIFQMGRYIYTSTEGGVPIIKQRKQKK
jgi:TolB-like protein